MGIKSKCCFIHQTLVVFYLIIFLSAPIFGDEEKQTTTPTPTTTTTTRKPDREDIADPCSSNGHFTDPKFTCCGGKRYDIPEILKNAANIDSCSKNVAITRGDKIVPASWNMFQCLVNKVIPGNPPDPEKFREILTPKDFPSDVKNKIAMYYKGLGENEYMPYAKLQESLGDDFSKLATLWNQYYVAENWACTELKESFKWQRVNNNEKDSCYGWIERSIRRGDCCYNVPVPFQLHPDPVVEKYFALKNYTATKLMTIIGEDFNWKNSSIVLYSDNVAMCIRTAKFILQGKFSLEHFSALVGNKTEPNYDAIADLIIPPTFPFGVQKEIQNDIANETAINLDYDIMKITEPNTSLYKYIYSQDWNSKSYNEDLARILFWHCRAHAVIFNRYVDFPMDDYCV